MLKEMFLLLVGSSPILAASNPIGFGMICIGAVALACGLWWLCNRLTGLWNRSFYLSWLHHVVCAFAALWTVFFCITFASVGEMSHVLDQVVTEWDAQMHSASELTEMGEQGSGTASDAESIGTDSELVRRFEMVHPFLREVLHSGQVDDDSDIRKVGSGYSSAQPIDRVAAGLKEVLQEQAHHAAVLLRSILLLSFVLVQGIAFFLTGYAAHRNIRPCS